MVHGSEGTVTWRPRLCALLCGTILRYLLQVVIPFLVLHGSEDTVTDPDISKELEQKSKSPDKTIKIYEGFWHSLTAGELDANMDSVFAVSLHFDSLVSTLHCTFLAPLPSSLPLRGDLIYHGFSGAGVCRFLRSASREVHNTEI